MQQKLTHLIQRYNTAASWADANPILLQGELGIESDTSKVKLGDGVTAWNSLDYFITMVQGSPYSAGNGVTLNEYGVLDANLLYQEIEVVS